MDRGGGRLFVGEGGLAPVPDTPPRLVLPLPGGVPPPTGGDPVGPTVPPPPFVPVGSPPPPGAPGLPGFVELALSN